MYHNARSVTRNANSGGQAQAGPQPIPSREGVGYSRSHPSDLGTGAGQPSGPCPKNAPLHPRQRGGQHTLGTFGLPSATGRPRRREATPTQARLSIPERRALLVVVLGSLSATRPSVHPELDALFADEPKATSAMRAVSAVSDAREAFPLDDEEADFLHRCQGAGFVELALAMD